MKIRVSIIYNRKKKLNSKGQALIQLLVYFNRNTKRYISTGIHIEPRFWDERFSLVSSRHEKAVEYNALIRNMIKEIESIEMKLMFQGRKFTPYALDAFLGSGKARTFNEFCDHEIDSANTFAKETVKLHKSSVKKLHEFNSKIYFSDLTFNLIVDFDKYLHDKGLKLNTIAKVHSIIKKFINLAITKDLMQIDDNPYKKFKVRRERTVRPWLSMSELKKIEAVSYDNNPALEKIKDMFLFACYTGLRFGDLSQLNKEYIIRNEKGELVIELHRMRKVDKKVYLPVTKLFDGKPAMIIEKYFKVYPDHELLFGVPITNQYLNREIKFIAKHAGVVKELSSHIARHTFGSILASVKPDPYLIMELMGHSKLATSMIYIHNSRERIDSQLDDIEWE